VWIAQLINGWQSSLIQLSKLHVWTDPEDEGIAFHVDFRTKPPSVTDSIDSPAVDE